MNIDYECAIGHFQKMIQFKTISDKDLSKVDESEFENFRSYIKETYIEVMNHSTLEIIEGGMLFKIKGKSDKNPSVLMSHFDVVPVNMDSWDVDPFEAVIKDGFIWGRGTIDTKCSLFSILESAEYLLKNDFVPENDLYFAFGCNEEIAGNCAPAIVDYLKSYNVKPAFVLDEGGMIYSLGENKFFPYQLAAIGIAEKGPMDVEFTVKGQSGHASRPPEHTAVGQLAEDIAKIEKNQFKMEMTAPNEAMAKALLPYLPKTVRPVINNMKLLMPILSKFIRKNNTASAFFRTTIAFTQLKGSNGANVLPDSATAVANVRLAQGMNSKDAVDHMLKSAGDPDLTARIINVSEATETSPAEGKYWDAVKSSIEKNFDNVVVAPYLMIGGTDSRFYDGYCPCIYKFAPVLTEGGLLGTIHSDNERIRVENLYKMIDFFTDLMKKL